MRGSCVNHTESELRKGGAVIPGTAAGRGRERRGRRVNTLLDVEGGEDYSSCAELPASKDQAWRGGVRVEGGGGRIRFPLFSAVLMINNMHQKRLRSSFFFFFCRSSARLADSRRHRAPTRPFVIFVLNEQLISQQRQQWESITFSFFLLSFFVLLLINLTSCCSGTQPYD